MFSNLSIFFVFLLGLCHYARSQVPFSSNCPDVKVIETFDLNKYMGTWYEYSKYPFIFEAGQKCQQAVYTNIGNDEIKVVNTGVYIIIDQPHSTNGTAKVIAPGKLAVSFRDQKVDNANYFVLGTDYDNWAVVYSCKNLSSFAHTELLWILTRSRQPKENDIQSAKDVITKNNLSESFLIKSNQNDCSTINESGNNEDQIAEASFSSVNAGSESSTDFAFPSTGRMVAAA